MSVKGLLLQPQSPEANDMRDFMWLVSLHSRAKETLQGTAVQLSREGFIE